METDTYLSKVRDLLNSCHVPGKELTAAWAGALVNLKVGSYKDLGFTNFRQVLEDLENQGFLTIVTTEKDALGIELIGHQPSFPGMVSGDSGMNSPTSNRKRVCHLAPKIWRAFVYVQPLGDRYLNKHTGEVLNADSAPSGEFWKKIEPIDVKRDQDLAEQFVAEKGLDIVIDPEDWPRKFISSLSVNRRQLKAWNNLRSNMVVDHVTKWAEANGVVRSILFSSPNNALKKEAGTRPRSTNKREIVLEAIRRMDDSELFDVKIRAKDLLNVIFE